MGALKLETASGDLFGRKKSVVHSSGLSGLFSYDSMNRTTSITWSGNDGTQAQNFSEVLTWDPLKDVITQVQREAGMTFGYGFDSVDQLTSTSYSGSTGLPDPIVNRTIAYTANGDRTTQSLINGVLTGDADFFYQPDSDGLGRLAQKTDRTTGISETFGYRADGLLTSYTNGNSGMQVAITYDPLGRRVAKTVTPNGQPAFTQAFSYFGVSHRTLMATAGNGDAYLYLNGQDLGEAFGEVSSKGAKAFIADHLGSIINSPVAGSSQAYGPFGEALGAPLTLASNTEPVLRGYAGGEFNIETGHTGFGPRTLDHQTGRWTTVDPFGFLGGDTNLYRYAGNQPTQVTDQTGTDAGVLPFTLPPLPVSPFVIPLPPYTPGQPFTYTNPFGPSSTPSLNPPPSVNSCPNFNPNTYTNPTSLPLTGPPNGSLSKTNPDGTPIQQRFYDQNGNPIVDIDYGHDHGAGVPHTHVWTPDPVTGKPTRQPPSSGSGNNGGTP